MKNVILAFVMVWAGLPAAAAIYRISEVKGKLSDSERLQRLFDLPDAKEKTVTFDLEGQVLRIDRPVSYRKVHDRITSIQGNGAIIYLENNTAFIGPDKGFGMRVGNGDSPDDIMANMDALRISDIRFEGKNAQYALRLAGTYQSRVERCRFVGVKNPLELIFCLQAVVEHCEFNKNLNALTIRSGMSIPEEAEIFPRWFSNASVYNSCSNRSVVRDCRFFGAFDGKTMLRIDASDGVRVENCIFEGFNPEYAVYMESRNSSTVPCFYLSDCHFEFVTYGEKSDTPKQTRALIKAHAQVQVVLSGIYSQYDACVQIDADAMQVIVERPAYLPFREKGFRAGKSSRWKFIDAWNNYEKLFDAASWDGPVPDELLLEQHGKLIGHGYTWNIAEIEHGQNLIINENRFKMEGSGTELFHGFERIVDTYNTLSTPESLDRFEIGELIPVVVQGPDGKSTTAYLPYLVRKKKTKPGMLREEDIPAK